MGGRGRGGGLCPCQPSNPQSENRLKIKNYTINNRQKNQIKKNTHRARKICWRSVKNVDAEAAVWLYVISIGDGALLKMTPLFNSLINKYPARVNNDQASKILGFNPDEIRILVTYGHLKPIAKPKQNSHKYFTLVDLCEKAIDPEWITKSTGTVYKHWNTKNSNKLKPCDSE